MLAFPKEEMKKMDCRGKTRDQKKKKKPNEIKADKQRGRQKRQLEALF